jgi:glutathione S-transferase
MLNLAGVAHAYAEVDLNLPREARGEPFRSLSKFGEVPLLVHDGRALAQSNAILLHLAAHTGTFDGESHQRREQVREWLFWEASRIGFSLPNLRFCLRFPGSAPAGVAGMLRERFDADITRIDRELADGRPFILGEVPTVADLSLCSYMFWAEQAQVTLPMHVQRWLGSVSDLPGWRHPYAFDA